MSKNKRHFLFSLLLMSIIALIWWGAIPQDLAYHNFADQRQIWGIPNFWNVMSNLPFFFVGLWSFKVGMKNFQFRPDFTTKWLPIVLSSGIFMACFGSAYYHWHPNNFTLVWDRLPMTLMFMPIFALIIYDFIGAKWGKISFFTFVPLGIFSVFYWMYTEYIGQGDLRFYAFVQFAPMLLGPIIIWLSPKKVPYLKHILWMLAWYVLAKFCEHFDTEVYATLTFWSGHTIKHLLGAVSLIHVVKLIEDWEAEILFKI